MYIPRHHAETDLRVLHELLRAQPLGAWVTCADGELAANHIPFLLDSRRGTHGTLTGHVARANPVWRTCAGTQRSLVIFQGAQTYISPSWYPGKRAHGRVVPTWNYVVVHAHGVPRVIDDRAWLLDHLEKLTDAHESGQPSPWKVADAPGEYIEQMLQHIVGIEIPIEQLVGKWKVSQNRSAADKSGVVAGLDSRADPRAAEMASLVAHYAACGRED
jgi:transcriptional regulator